MFSRENTPSLFYTVVMAKANGKQQAAQNMDALFGARQGERLVSNGFKMLAHERITVRPQVRRTFDADEMDELRASIRELGAHKSGIEGTGVLQALLVAPEGEGYRLIAGEKRFRATRDEGLPLVPCVIVPAVSEGMTRLLQLTENALRSAPPVLEEARALRETADEQGLSVRDLARVLGKTPGYVTNRMALLKMAPDVWAMVEARGDTLKHAPLIQAVQDPELRAELIHAVVEDEISVKALERRLQPAEASRASAAQDDQNTDVDTGQASAQAPAAPRSEPRHSKERDPVGDLLKPAAKMAQEASRLLAGASLTPDYKKQVRAQTHALEGTLADIKRLLR